MVFPVLSVRPEEIVIRATSERGLPTIFFKAIDRPRIRIAVVEVSNFLRYIKRRRW
jgi:hypothetical protein